MTEWLSIPECAQLLGVRDSQVRELLRDRVIVAARRGENNALAIPAGFVEGDEGEAHVLSTLRGTITVLTDAGMEDEEIVEWLIEPHDELGVSPIEALRQGRRAPVRRAAQTLF